MIENDGWRVGVLYESPLTETLKVVVGRRMTGGARQYVTKFDSTGEIETCTREQAEGYAAEPPTIDLPTDVARALLEALAQHFGGTGAVRQLRKDHDAERERVDKLIGVLSVVATRGSSRD